MIQTLRAERPDVLAEGLNRAFGSIPTPLTQPPRTTTPFTERRNENNPRDHYVDDDEDDDDEDEEKDDRRESKRPSRKFPSLPSKDVASITKDDITLFIADVQEHALITGNYDIAKLVDKLADTPFQYEAARIRQEAVQTKSAILNAHHESGSTSRSETKRLRNELDRITKATFLKILDSIGDDTGLLFDSHKAASQLMTITMKSCGSTLEDYHLKFKKVTSKFTLTRQNEILFIERYLV